MEWEYGKSGLWLCKPIRIVVESMTMATRDAFFISPISIRFPYPPLTPIPCIPE